MNGNEMYVIRNKQLISFQYCFSILYRVYKKKRYKPFLTSEVSAGKVLQRAARLAGLSSVRRKQANLKQATDRIRKPMPSFTATFDCIIIWHSMESSEHRGASLNVIILISLFRHNKRVVSLWRT